MTITPSTSLLSHSVPLFVLSHWSEAQNRVSSMPHNITVAHTADKIYDSQTPKMHRDECYYILQTLFLSRERAEWS